MLAHGHCVLTFKGHVWYCPCRGAYRAANLKVSGVSVRPFFEYWNVVKSTLCMNGNETKHKAEKRDVAPASRKSLTWPLLVGALIASLVLLVIRAKLFPGKTPAAKTGGQTGRESSLAMASEVMGLSSAPNDAVLPTDAELGDPDQSTTCLNLGNELLSRGKLDEAAAEYREAVRLNPKNQDAHFNLGTALAKQGHSAEAKEQYVEALRIQPDHTEARYQLALAYLSEHRTNEAMGELAKILAGHPDYAPARRVLAQVRQLQTKMSR